MGASTTTFVHSDFGGLAVLGYAVTGLDEAGLNGPFSATTPPVIPASCEVGIEGDTPGTPLLRHRDPRVRRHVRVDDAVPGSVRRAGEPVHGEVDILLGLEGIEHVHRCAELVLQVDGGEVVCPLRFGHEQ